jgi:hypothetical protein
METASVQPLQRQDSRTQNGRYGRSQPWTRRVALKDGQLVTQREVLEHQGALGPDPTKKTCEDEGDHAGHHRSGRPKVNVDETDGVSRRHTQAERMLADRTRGFDPGLRPFAIVLKPEGGNVK